MHIKTYMGNIQLFSNMCDDEMENNWGSELVRVTGTDNRTSRRENFSWQIFDGRVRSSVPGYCLEKVVDCGTSANAYAIDKLTDRDWTTLLVGMGSYVGGDMDLQPFSSTIVATNKQLSWPKLPITNSVEVSNVCRKQTVALPYHVPCEDISARQIYEYEQKCLVALHKKLLVAQFAGKPYRALLMEYLLGGNGGELSHRFLERLAPILHKFNVCVIADEIMTAGRVSVTTMTMTTTLPKIFSSQVVFITTGKFTDSGMVLKKVMPKPLELNEALRGTTTHFPIARACAMWGEVMARVETGIVSQRKTTVLKAINLEKSQHWGHGCLIFIQRNRPGCIRGLGCRLLPMLEAKLKIGKLRSNSTSWSRSTVCKRLISAGDEWIVQMRQNDEENNPILLELVEFIGSQSNSDSVIQFTDAELAEHIVAAERRKTTDGVFARMKKRFPHSQKQFKTFVRQNTSAAARNIVSLKDKAGSCGFLKKRLGKKRRFGVMVDRNLLGFDLVTEAQRGSETTPS